MTKDLIVKTGTQLLFEKGYNGFSYADISEKVNIRKASIHYHFPTKADLAVAIIEEQIGRIEKLRQNKRANSAEQRLKNLISYYVELIKHGQICLMGALAVDGFALEPKVKTKSAVFCDVLQNYTTEILKSGVLNEEFKPIENITVKTIELLSSLMGLAQISRILPPKGIIPVAENMVLQLKAS